MKDDAFKKSAHDLNNLLTGIINGIDLLNQKLENKEEVHEVVDRLSKTSNRARDIVQSMLNTNNIKRRKELIDLGEITNEVISNFSVEEQNRIELVTDKELPKIIAENNDVYRVLQNLCKNALEATEKEGSVKIFIKRKTINNKQMVVVEIVDNGIGIDKDKLNKIFEPKFSTKVRNHESGFGLSIVKEKIESLSGQVDVTSENNSTRFSITLPAVDKHSTAINILLSEDDESVSEVLADLLNSQGFNVTLAINGKETIEKALETNFDFMIIDKQLPDFDGLECISKIREVKREVPIILASGYEVDETNNEIKNLGINQVIKKPYNLPEILAAINKFQL